MHQSPPRLMFQPPQLRQHIHLHPFRSIQIHSPTRPSTPQLIPSFASIQSTCLHLLSRFSVGRTLSLSRLRVGTTRFEKRISVIAIRRSLFASFSDVANERDNNDCSSMESTAATPTAKTASLELTEQDDKVQH